MSYMNDGCDPFGIPYVEKQKKIIKKEEEKKPTERFTIPNYGGLVTDNLTGRERMELWIFVKIANQMDKEIKELKKENEECKLMIRTLRNIILENGFDLE